MQIDKGSSAAVVVKRKWANLHGVKMFLRPHESQQGEIRGVDESHILFATVIESDDSRGVWIEMDGDQQPSDSALGPIRLLIPWRQILTIVMADQFPASIRKKARKIGFTGEMESE